MGNNRRTFLKAAGISALGIGTAPVFNLFASSKAEGTKLKPEYSNKKSALPAKHWGMVIDTRKFKSKEDMEPVIESFMKTNRAVVVEEGWRSYGVGSEVVSRIYEQAFDYVDAPIVRVAQKEVPLPYNQTLEQLALPQVDDVIKAVKEVM